MPSSVRESKHAKALSRQPHGAVKRVPKSATPCDDRRERFCVVVVVVVVESPSSSPSRRRLPQRVDELEELEEEEEEDDDMSGAQPQKKHTHIVDLTRIHQTTG